MRHTIATTPAVGCDACRTYGGCRCAEYEAQQEKAERRPEPDLSYVDSPQEIACLLKWMQDDGRITTVADAIHVVEHPAFYAEDWAQMVREVRTVGPERYA